MGRNPKGLTMKKFALMLVAAATLAASVSVPAEARGLRGVRVARPAVAIAAATAAAIAADAYLYNGYGYYALGVVYYGGPGYYGYPAVRYGW
jgi:enoyl-[acyl-carrier-protein] reductase (NADH)